MIVTLAIPTLLCFDRLATCIESVQTGSMPPNRILIIDNSGGQCPQIDGGEIVLGRQPQSVAKAWNDAATLVGSGEWLMLANDDMLFAPDSIERMISVAMDKPKAGIVSPIEGARFACFLLRYQAYLEVGPFDEQFKMAYFEDNDYAWRLTLKGWQLALAPSNVRHAGSATIRAMDAAQLDEKHRAYRHNESYYQRKWGNAPGHEQFTVPFGGRI